MTMAILQQPALSLPVVMATMSHFDRSKLEAFISVAIDLLDLADGEPDMEDDDPREANGDEGDHESIYATPLRYGPNQAEGPINVHIGAQRYDLRRQLEDAADARDARRAQHLRNRLRLLDVQEAHLIGRNR